MAVTDHVTEVSGIEIATADAISVAADWDALVDRSPEGGVMHTEAALRVQADHSGTTLHRLVAVKGQEPIGLFPVFERRAPGFSAAFSPPPDLWIPYLGPVLLGFDRLKRRREELRHRRFVDAAFEWIDAVFAPQYVSLRTDPRYPNPRPFDWNGFQVRPRHTFVVDLTRGPDALIEAFSSDARRNVRTDREYEIREGGPEAIERILEQVRARHEAKDEQYDLPVEFPIALHERLPDGAVRPYVCTVDGEFCGGLLVLEDGDTVYRWQGGTKPDSDLPVNDLLDWHVIREAAERGLARYDLVGANVPEVAEYKAKFDPELAEYYALERGSMSVRAAARLYQRLSR